LGGGYQERIYQAALRSELGNNGMAFLEQAKGNIIYDGAKLHRYYLDFIIEQKIVVELKVTPRFTPREIMQVLGYLKQSGLELGILVSLNRRGVHFKRILRGK
jgi:GxxExxY protein